MSNVKEKDEKNDWEDESWEDEWGDAEDDIVESKIDENSKKETKKEEKQDASESVIRKNIEKEIKPNTSQSPVDESTRAPPTPPSWGSMWKPFGGVVSNVLNQVIGAPDPEELARINAEEKAKDQEVNKEKNVDEEENLGLPLVGLVSGVTTFGSKVLNTGLDTLEGIGKKTMTILQESDPLLKNKRKLLGLEQDKPNLSEILREAKKDADQLEDTLKQLQLEKAKTLLRFDTIFEQECGLVHLEALEILSRESNLKLDKLLESVSGNALKALQDTIQEVKTLAEFEDVDGESVSDYTAVDLKARLTNAIKDLSLNINFDDLSSDYEKMTEWISSNKSTSSDIDEQAIFARGITVLASSCALEVNKLHKIAELLLIKKYRNTLIEVEQISHLCREFNVHLSGITKAFANWLNERNTEEAKECISTLFSEMMLGQQQIQKSYKLFLPIMQIGAA